MKNFEATYTDSFPCGSIFSAKIVSPRRHGTVPVMVRAFLVIERVDETYQKSMYHWVGVKHVE